MRTTITVDDEKIETAKELTGIEDTASVMRAALDALIQQEAARRLIAMGGTMPDLEETPRRRQEPDDFAMAQ
jgi:hypothetical protein